MLIGLHEKTPFKPKHWSDGIPTCQYCSKLQRGHCYIVGSSIVCYRCCTSRGLPLHPTVEIPDWKMPEEEKLDKYNGETTFYALKMNDILQLSSIETMECVNEETVMNALEVNLMRYRCRKRENSRFMCPRLRTMTYMLKAKLKRLYR